MPQAAQKTREIYVCIDTYLIREIPHQLVKAVFSGRDLPIALQGGKVDPCDFPQMWETRLYNLRSAEGTVQEEARRGARGVIKCLH